MTAALGTSERDQDEVRAAIADAFGDRAGVAIAYAEFLATAGIERGLIGPREADRVWRRHILNSVAIAALVPREARVVDLGSGAGLPGIPLAIARPDLDVVLLEPMQRRVQFLTECLDLPGMPGVTVCRGRAEDGVAPLADVVVARAVAPFERLVRLSAALLVDNGMILALKGSGAAGELEQARRTMDIDADLLTLPAPGQPATVLRAARPSRGPVPVERRSRGPRRGTR